MNGDDDVGLIADEEVAQPLAVERLAETHERLIAPAAVGRVVERAVDRRSVAQGHAVAEPELREREGAVGGDVFDAVLEGVRRARLRPERRRSHWRRCGARRPCPKSTEAPVWSFALPLGSGRRPPRSAPAGIARPSARRAESGQQRPSRGIVEAKNIAKLDFGVSVMAVVVLGKHDRQRPKGPPKPGRRAPSELGRVAPPDVELPEREAGERAGPARGARQGPPRRGTAARRGNRRATRPGPSKAPHDRSTNGAGRGACAGAA